MSGKTNGVSLVVSDNHIAINADINFNVESSEEVPNAHISDIIYQLILEGLKKHDKAVFGGGEYKAFMSFCATSIAEQPTVEGLSPEELASMVAAQAGEDVDRAADDLVEEMLNEVPKSDDQ
jgi:hypothetical protein